MDPENIDPNDPLELGAPSTEGTTPQVEQVPNNEGTGDDLDESEADRAMAAGFAAARSGKEVEFDPSPEAKEAADGTDPADPDAAPAATPAPPAPTPEEDAEARREARLAAAERTAQTLAGHVGHLKQLVEKRGQAKPITKESLTRMREEFGDDYADAVAADLTALGIGAPLSVSQEDIEARIEERVHARTEQLARKVETIQVKTMHPDAEDYFAGGKHNAAFGQWANSLPTEKRDELMTSWDAPTVGKYLSEFKELRAKASTRQARQESRIERAAVPTTGTAANAAPPAVDPMEQGFRNVRGNRKPIYAR